MGNPGAHRSRQSIVTGLVGLVAIAAYAAVGATQTLVWNPLAAAPGTTLDEIRAALGRANESLGEPLVLVWAIIGVVLAALVVLLAALLPAMPAPVVLATDLWLLVLAAPAHMFVAFGAGMSLADTFGISGGDHAPWGALLYAISAVALLALVATTLRQVLRARHAALPAA
ncbi:hypothetical protein BJQ94_01050 [Cryobacterium sp. SO2]|uniref:hypothetical protein n=1 Tax=Cryobacterium sp. SO2 TaxID=1897060 RepID=UPI00223CBF71|nr:hypothetical protein [Cryobacterium sp. SO2]WEO77673.1 hypothetical protein BJQ94_01050 [Cryobacterium sp. SO2]